MSCSSIPQNLTLILLHYLEALAIMIPSRSSPPDTVRSHVEQDCREGEQVLLWLSTDIDPSGQFAERWLAITDTRILTIDPNSGHPSTQSSFALKDVTKVSAANRIGYVSLEVDVSGSRHDVVCASNVRAGDLHQVARGLNDREKNDGKLKFDLDEEEVQYCESCGRLLPEKDSFCPHCLKRTKVILRIWGYMQPHWRKAILMSGLALISTLLNLAPPYLTKILVDDVLMKTGTGWMLLPLVAALAALYVSDGLTKILQGRMSATLSTRIMHDVRIDLYQAMQGLTFRRFDKTQTGTLMSRLLHDTGRLNWMLIDLSGWFLPTVMELVGILAVLFYMDWLLAVLMLLPVPLFLFGMTWFHKMIHRIFHRHWKRRDKMSAVANDALSGLRVVKAFAQEPREISRFENRSWEVYKVSRTEEQAFSTFFPALNVLIMVGGLLVWFVGGKTVLGEIPWHGGMTLGTLMAFLAYMARFYGPLDWMTMIANHVNQAITAAQRLFELIDADREVYDDPEAAKLGRLEGAVEFRDVRFGYRKDKEVLKGISLKVKPGEMIGLVGRSGVGKTTLTNLICRFYDVNEGAILMDGVNLKDANISDLRKQIGIVPQESFLFNGSIKENITYAKADATPEEMIRCASAAHALGFICRQPDGFDTRVGEHGGRLSGGEKQRISIARAILHDPRILILDEATSSVDTETEEQIQKALQNLVKGRTTFAIAHRLSTLKHANRLVVMDDGKIAEIGTHDELVEQKGVYNRLVTKQTEMSRIKVVEG
jgi:ATP-binding cassette, subfamily B, bacterial